MAASWRAIGGKCRALMMAAKSSTAASATVPKAAKPAKRPSTTGEAPMKGILQPLPVSSQLREFLGSSQASRTDAVKKVWDHIKIHGLQNPSNKKEIICDEKLKTLFGKDRVGFLEIAKLLSQHFVKSG